MNRKRPGTTRANLHCAFTNAWRTLPTMILIAILGLLLVAGTGPARADSGSKGCTASAPAQGRRLDRTLNVEGKDRAYILDVPDGVQAGTPVPLLFDFHGFNHSGAGVWKVSAFKDIATREPFITVYPEGLTVHMLDRDGAGWDIFKIEGNRDLAFVRAMLAAIDDAYCIDHARVFSTGFSNGAFFSHLLACTMADRFAAVAPVSGGNLDLPCTPSRPVPIMIHHGRNDPVVKVELARTMRDAWVEKNGCSERSDETCEWRRGCRGGAEVAFCENDAGHHWPPAATERIWSFLRSHPMP